MTLRLQTLHGGAEVPGGAFRLTNEQIQVAEKLREGWTLWHDWSELEEGIFLHNVFDNHIFHFR